MKYDPERHHRRSTRLPRYDYTGAGAYFITIVTQGRECVFGEVVDGVMHPNAAGQMVQRIWLDLANQFSDIALDSFVVMPNHFHGIVFIPDVGATLVVAQDRVGTSPTPTEKPPRRAGTSPAPTNTGRRWALGEIVGAFKSSTTHACIQGVEQAGWLPFPGRLWQ